MNDTRTSKWVKSKEGRYLGRRCVMYCPRTKMYVMNNCVDTTPNRVWAWSGTRAQSEMAREMFGISSEYVLYLDGEEKGSV